MATPALRLLRDHQPGAFIGALVRPGLDALLDGCELIDEFHIDRPTGVLGPKRVAWKLRPRQYDAAILFTNSFSSALIARIAGVGERFGYIRDARGSLLTGGIRPHRNGRDWRVTPAVDYYWRLVSSYLGEGQETAPNDERVALATTPPQDAAASDMLPRAGLVPTDRYAVLIPGASKEAKRWPAERFSAIADHLIREHGLRAIVSGSPAERGVCERVIASAEEPVASLVGLGGDLGSLKAIIRGCSILVCNDTGPRHIGAAFGVPTVALFGPTDHRWTTLRGVANQRLVLADPSLPASESANDHPTRCAITRIETDRVIGAVESLFGDLAG